MIQEIKEKYKDFADALICEFHYKNSIDSPSSKGQIEIIIKCMNAENEYAWETIKLHFNDVLNFRFVEQDKTSSTVINSALLMCENSVITLDFFPLIFDNSVLNENIHSDFVIKSKELTYSVLKK